MCRTTSRCELRHHKALPPWKAAASGPNYRCWRGPRLRHSSGRQNYCDRLDRHAIEVTSLVVGGPGKENGISTKGLSRSGWFRGRRGWPASLTSRRALLRQVVWHSCRPYTALLAPARDRKLECLKRPADRRGLRKETSKRGCAFRRSFAPNRFFMPTTAGITPRRGLVVVEARRRMQ